MSSRRRWTTLAAVVVAAAALVGVVRRPAASSSSLAAPAISAARQPAPPVTEAPDAPGDPELQGGGGPPASTDLGEADGALPHGVTVFDDGVPAVANLDPALLSALRRAATAAEGVGVTVLVDSGWRSAAYQEHLLQAAISKYGSEAVAARWVAPPNRSEHVKGEAVDLGPTAAVSWMSRHGARYGLCQVYRNEPWHYELRSDAVVHGCPQMYADPTEDPRLQS